ncbi:hypothetical protein [Tardiphaga sp. P9-11]|uniref:hypothetical protein n=1 Tax=Tardiphaga sp. P9-11 TaxID=2024614 RepID=UPI0011F3E506|nr:hypothetical protein [Tardiphaga sp. P9-11]
MITYSKVCLLAGCLLLSACGAVVPEMNEFYERPEQQRHNERRIIGQIQCELREGVRSAIKAQRDKVGGPTVDWLIDWGAKVNLNIVADEKGSLAPGASLTQMYGLNKFTFGGGLDLSSNATRDETVEFTYAFAELLAQSPKSCTPEDAILIKSNLKIGDFINNKADLAGAPGVARMPFSVFSWKVSFIVVYGASATPTYEFIDVTAGTGNPFVNVSRTKTHTATITIAPLERPSRYRQRAIVRLSDEGESIHAAAVFGQATANAIRSQQRR